MYRRKKGAKRKTVKGGVKKRSDNTRGRVLSKLAERNGKQAWRIIKNKMNKKENGMKKNEKYRYI